MTVRLFEALLRFDLDKHVLVFPIPELVELILIDQTIVMMARVHATIVSHKLTLAIFPDEKFIVLTL